MTCERASKRYRTATDGQGDRVEAGAAGSEHQFGTSVYETSADPEENRVS